MDELEKKAQEIENSIKEAKNESAEVKKELQEVKKSMEDSKTDIEKKFDNVDESLKEIKKAMEQKEEKKEKTLEQELKAIFESAEFKTNMADLKSGKIGRFSHEVKVDTSGLTGDVNRTQQDTRIYGPAVSPLSFLNRVPRNTVPADKNRVMYVNASFVDHTDYVGEGQAVATANTASAAEAYREIAKIGNFLPFSSEVMEDMSYFMNWAKNQSAAAIYAKVDNEIWNGDGSDEGNKKHIYGIKAAATAFNAAIPGLANEIEDADAMALMLAAKAQIEVSTNEAYTPNVVYLSAGELVKFINLRDKNGNKINFPDFQKALGCEILSSSKLKGKEMFMGDINVIQLHEKRGFELEVERVASTDTYVMYLRWRGNLTIADEPKKAIVYIPDIDTAIAAIAKA
jgi:HK97 family phage major capsid protein